MNDFDYDREKATAALRDEMMSGGHNEFGAFTRVMARRVTDVIDDFGQHVCQSNANLIAQSIVDKVLCNPYGLDLMPGWLLTFIPSKQPFAGQRMTRVFLAGRFRTSAVSQMRKSYGMGTVLIGGVSLVSGDRFGVIDGVE